MEIERGLIPKTGMPVQACTDRIRNRGNPGKESVDAEGAPLGFADDRYTFRGRVQ